MSAQRLSGNLSGGDILPISASDLVGFCERGEGVADRHLAGLVALHSHPFEDLATGEAVASLDELEKLLALAPATHAGSSPGASPARCCSPSSRFPGLCRFVGVDRGELSIDEIKLLLQFLLLGKDRFALGIEAVAFTLYKRLESFVSHSYPPYFLGGNVMWRPLSEKASRISET